MVLKYGSLFAGIGGFDLGFDRAGMECQWQVEKDKFCLQVLEKYWPDVERFEDVRKVGRKQLRSVDVICGGFPCQDVSVAGKGEGLDGKRSGLWFEFHRIIGELKPDWVVIENVPGLLSSNGGRDFTTVLRGLAEFGYYAAWRILDAQFYGVPQRRRRVFVVASLGDGRCTQVLFERESSPWDTPSSREEGTEPARTTPKGIGVGGSEVGYALRKNPSRSGDKGDGGVNTNLAIVKNFNAFNGYTGGADDNDTQGNHLVVFGEKDSHTAGNPVRSRGMPVLSTTKREAISSPDTGVRRLIPTECERLQGFPDGHTAGQSDTQRYRQLGNAVAVPVAEWLGKRIG